MDYVFVKFTNFLWAYTFIAPLSCLFGLRGTIILRFRTLLHKIGIIYPKCDYEALAATLLLEHTQAIHHCGRTEQDDKLGNVAGFLFPDFPYVDGNCEMEIAGLFAVDIDLDTKRFAKAKLDKLLWRKKPWLWYNTIAAQHVRRVRTAEYFDCMVHLLSCLHF